MPHLSLRYLWVGTTDTTGSWQDLEAEKGGKWEGGSYKICNKEIEPIIVDPAPQKLAEHILFVPVNLTSPFI